MSATLSFSPKTPSALLDALSKAQWPAVVEAIEAGYPINVKDAEGNPFFSSFIKKASSETDPLSISWHAAIVEALVFHGLTDSPIDAEGNRPIALAVKALRWDLVRQLHDKGHVLQSDPGVSLWIAAKEGFKLAVKAGENLTQKETSWHVGWCLQKTLDVMIDRKLKVDDTVPEVIDFLLEKNLDRVALRLMKLGVPVSHGDEPAFVHALRGSHCATLFRLLQEPSQAQKIKNASREDVAYWWDVVANRRNTDVLDVMKDQLEESLYKESKIDLLASCIKSGWSVTLGQLIAEGIDFNEKLVDGRNLAHAAAQHASLETLTLLRAERMDFSIGVDPWTGLTPIETIAKRFPDFQALPATILPLRRKNKVG